MGRYPAQMERDPGPPRDPDDLSAPHDAWDPDLEPEAFDERAGGSVDPGRRRVRVVAGIVLAALVLTGPAAWLLLRDERGSVTYRVPAFERIRVDPGVLREGDRLVCANGSEIEVGDAGGPEIFAVQGPDGVTTWQIDPQPDGSVIVRCS